MADEIEQTKRWNREIKGPNLVRPDQFANNKLESFLSGCDIDDALLEFREGSGGLGAVADQNVLSRHPSTAAIAARASAACRTSALDQFVCPLGR